MGFSVFAIHFYVVPLCAEAIQLALRSSLGGISLYVGVDSVCPREEVGSESSYAAILDPSPSSLGFNLDVPSHASLL